MRRAHDVLLDVLRIMTRRDALDTLAAEKVIASALAEARRQALEEAFDLSRGTDIADLIRDLLDAAVR